MNMNTKIIAIAFLLSSCVNNATLLKEDGTEVLMKDAPKMRPPFVVQMNDKPIDFPFACYRTGEILSDDQDYWESEVYSLLSFHTYEKFGDISRSYGNVTYGYARVSPNYPSKDLCTQTFDTQEVDAPYAIARIQINTEFIITEVWPTVDDPVSTFHVYSNDCLTMDGVRSWRKLDIDGE